MKRGDNKIVTIIAPNPPKDTKRISSFPLPSNKRAWPGKIDKTVPSSGTPRKVDGMNSNRAWAIDMENNKTHKNSGDKLFNRNGDEANKKAPAVFTWIPGIKPVKVPHKTPIKQAIIRSNNKNPFPYFINKCIKSIIYIWCPFLSGSMS